MVKLSLDNPKYYINREWSWLEFNNRVLNEAVDVTKPLLERLKFISIAASNLEEFFMVRVAGLKQLQKAGLSVSSVDMKSPNEQLDGIREIVRNMLDNMYDLLNNVIVPSLKEKGVIIVQSKKKLNQYRDKLENMFLNDIKPVITPLSVSPTHPFPNLITGRFYIAVELRSNIENAGKIEKGELSFIEIPVNIYGRFIEIEENIFIAIEDVIKLFVDNIYTGYEVVTCGLIKITRDADFEIEEDEVSDLLIELELKLKRMHIRSAVKLEFEKDVSDKIVKTLINIHNLTEPDIYIINGMLNLNDLLEICNKSSRQDLKNPGIIPIESSMCKSKDIFKQLQNEDFILFHPYHSYSPIVELVNRAADDKNVLAIKQLLYRTSPTSPIISALIRAAEKGKHVSVVVELKARFDERRNIEWAKRLEDSGANVIYGISGLKTHAKALLIIRREKMGIKRYIQLATGNYNESTAKLYTDLSFFTSNKFYGNDVSSLFNLLTGFSLPNKWEVITAAPMDLREKIISLINRETKNAKKGLRGRIIAKMNSLADKAIAKKLYEASIAGVKIDLIVRGICIVKPGINKVSENIRIRSIIGQFLEHARIYYFYNGGESEHYLSSADWMTRNLDRRIELLFPVESKGGKKFIDKILEIQLNDTKNSWQLNSKGKYNRIKSKYKSDNFKELYTMIKKKEKAKKTTEDIILSSIKNQK